MINLGRKFVADCLSNVIEHCLGKSGVSEQSLKNAWLEEISESGTLSRNGWYSPPENGMAVLVCSNGDVSRSHFRSFRDPQFFASTEPIDWSDALIIAYASNISVKSGLPADFATTLYFGSDKQIKGHFRRSIASCRQLFSELDQVYTGKELFGRLEDILGSVGIDGRTWSSTDQDYNFGHTLPVLDPQLGSNHSSLASDDYMVSDNTAEAMRKERNFLSRESELDLRSGIQFTIEPQCVSLDGKAIPKVMIHYVSQFAGGHYEICSCCEDLPIQYGLCG